MITVLNDGDIQIDDITVLEHFVAGYAVAYLVINRGADGFRVGCMSARCVVERGRDSLLNIDDQVMAELIQLVGGHASLDERSDVVAVSYTHLRAHETRHDLV